MRPSLPLLFSVLSPLFAASLLAVACTDNGDATTPDDGTADAAADTGKKKPGTDSGGGTTDDGGTDAGNAYCDTATTYYATCKVAPNCGADFPAWCLLNDQAINSQQFRAAEIKCMPNQLNCDGDNRADCEYRSLAAATPTAAQQALVTAYCQTCQPSNANCAKESTGYDPDAGPSSVGDIFIAAWEFNDTITTLMKTTCTGASLDAGADASAAACAKAFAGCTADVYLNHVPDCPK